MEKGCKPKMKNYFSSYFYKHTLKHIFTSFVLIFILIPSIIVLAFSYAYSMHTLKKVYAREYISAIESEYEKNLSMILNHLNLVMLNITTHKEIYTAIIDHIENPEVANDIVVNELKKLFENTEMISGIEIITHQGFAYKYFKKPIETQGMDKLIKKDNSSSFVIGDTCVKSGDDFYLVVSKKLFNYYNSYHIGDFVVYINENIFSSLYQKFPTQKSSFFLTVNDTIISHPDKKNIGTKIFIPNEVWDYFNIDSNINNKYIIDTYNISKKYMASDMKTVCILSYDDIVENVRKINIYVIIVTILSCILTFFMALYVAIGLTKKIECLKGQMMNFDLMPNMKFVKNKSNEILALEESFERMVKRINNLIEEINESNEKRRIAELNAMQAQINPHFIYNVLDIISCTAKLHKQSEIEQMIHALASYFRISLNRGNNYITVRDEIEHVKKYLLLEKMRFPDLFETRFEIDERILEYRIVKIILQPLIENSIKHGFSKMNKKGLIVVKGYLTEDSKLEFHVSDNGVGTDINPLISSNYQNSLPHRGYGLKNIHERLVLAYGEGYGIEFYSKRGEGTIVKVRIKTEVEYEIGSREI